MEVDSLELIYWTRVRFPSSPPMMNNRWHFLLPRGGEGYKIRKSLQKFWRLFRNFLELHFSLFRPIRNSFIFSSKIEWLFCENTRIRAGYPSKPLKTRSVRMGLRTAGPLLRNQRNPLQIRSSIVFEVIFLVFSTCHTLRTIKRKLDSNPKRNFLTNSG